ncbi:hypothetical protein GIB67_032429 [Kingdonia uniflora]|uniref:Uncharacterized protein n=1 Tax=Kingdonia uniflora TaxID=39325 RepID=A0A7J7MIX7_9MAGN|nr:hypothetical protein GIB67_032429 [Kingdonia uniflora]
MVTTRRQAYEARVQTKMESRQTHYFGTQSLSLPTSIPVPPTFYGMLWEEVEEAEDDYHQMWRFHYVVLFTAHRRSCFRMLVEDAVAGEDKKVGISSVKYCRYPAKDWINKVLSTAEGGGLLDLKNSEQIFLTMDDSEVIGTIIVDKPVVPSGKDVGLHAGIEIRQFFMYPENVDVAKKFLQYKRSLNGKWGCYVMNAGLWFKTLVKPDGKINHYQVPSLDKWKGNMGIGDDIDIPYYNGTGAEVVEDRFLCYLSQVVYGLSIPLTFFQKGVMNALKSCPGQLNGNVFKMMKVCEALNKRWRDGGIARQFLADDVLKYYKFKYVKDRKSGYLFSDSARSKFFNFESAGRPWCDHLVMVRGNCMQVPGEPALELIYKNFNEKPNPKGVVDTSSLFDVVSREGTELSKVLGALGIRREKRLNSIVEKVRRAHQNRAMATSGSSYDDIMEIPACTLSVTWKSPAEVLKVAAADRAEYEVEKASLAEQLKERTALSAVTKKEVEDEAKKAVDIVVASRNKLIQAFYFWGLSREDVDLAFAGKYSKIIFSGDDVSPVAEQRLAPPVADNTTKEEVVRLRGKVSEMEKALSRARDSINRTQQGQRAMRILFFNIEKEDRRVQAQLKNDLKHARDELELYKDHNACLEMEKVECNKLLQSSDKRVILLEARLLDT